MGERVEVHGGAIRCELGGVDCRTTTELLRSMVHHHCARCDVSVDLVEALDVALDDLVDTVWHRWGGISSIEMDSSCERLGLRLIGPSDRALAGPALLGPVAAALFGHIAVEREAELVVSCVLAGPRRP